MAMTNDPNKPDPGKAAHPRDDDDKHAKHEHDDKHDHPKHEGKHDPDHPASGRHKGDKGEGGMTADERDAAQHAVQDVAAQRRFTDQTTGDQRSFAQRAAEQQAAEKLPLDDDLADAVPHGEYNDPFAVALRARNVPALGAKPTDDGYEVVLRTINGPATVEAKGVDATVEYFVVRAQAMGLTA
jgi:hypothetical protein